MERCLHRDLFLYCLKISFSVSVEINTNALDRSIKWYYHQTSLRNDFDSSPKKLADENVSKVPRKLEVATGDTKHSSLSLSSNSKLSELSTFIFLRIFFSSSSNPSSLDIALISFSLNSLWNSSFTYIFWERLFFSDGMGEKLDISPSVIHKCSLASSIVILLSTLFNSFPTKFFRWGLYLDHLE